MTLDTYIVQIFIQPGLWLVLCIVCRQVSSCEKLFVALVMVMVSLAGVASTWSVINGLASQEILSLPCYLNITQKIWWSLRNNSTYQSFCMTIHVRDAVMLWCCDAVMLWLWILCFWSANVSYFCNTENVWEDGFYDQELCRILLATSLRFNSTNS